MGRLDGAGEAWKVAPAKAVATADLDVTVCGGVVRPCFDGPGEEGICLERDLFPGRDLDLELGCCWDPGAGLLAPAFCGVKGL